MGLAGRDRDFKAIWGSQTGGQPYGHRHFWDRALTRRQVLGGTASLAGVAAIGAPFGLPAAAAAPGRGEPRPIPGGTQIDGLGFFHFFFPTANNPVGATDTIESGRGDPSLVTDFNGFIGVGEWAGGTGEDQNHTTLFWAADLRFMDGEFIGLDGRHRQGAFAFV